MRSTQLLVAVFVMFTCSLTHADISMLGFNLPNNSQLDWDFDAAMSR
jgi:hypothetical protein